MLPPFNKELSTCVYHVNYNSDYVSCDHFIHIFQRINNLSKPILLANIKEE